MLGHEMKCHIKPGGTRGRHPIGGLLTRHMGPRSLMPCRAMERYMIDKLSAAESMFKEMQLRMGDPDVAVRGAESADVPVHGLGPVAPFHAPNLPSQPLYSLLSEL